MPQDYKCKKCTNPDPIPEYRDTCPACGAQVPPPNVRAAETAVEIEALDVRLRMAEAETEARNCREILDGFGSKVDDSKAVVACPVTRIKEIISNNALYNTFYKQVYSDARMPEDNKFDKNREAVDSKLFPGYYKEIVFAALSLGGEGIKAYGGAFVVLKDDAIRERSSVFEMNTFTFAEIHRIGIADPIPLGYRAPWKDRGKLAKAKLHARIEEITKEDDYPNILLNSDAPADGADFIEVHIFRGFSRGAIEKVYLLESGDPADKIIAKSVQQRLKQLDIPCEHM